MGKTKKKIKMGQVFKFDVADWLTLRMLRGNIRQDIEDNNLLALKKEKELFNYYVNNILLQPEKAPIRARVAA